MAMTTLGDLSQMFQLRRDTVRVRHGLAAAAQELSSGKKADLGKSLSGNFGPLVALDRQLSALKGYETNAKEAKLFADTAQNALERVRGAGSDIGFRLATVDEAFIATIGSVFADESQGAFKLAVSALNSTVGGRSVFSGAATDQPALATGDTMLADIRSMAALASATTAADVVAVVDDYFYTTGGGFETNGYKGSNTPISTFRVTEDRSIDMQIKADDTVIRDQLRGFALAAMLEGAGLTSSTEKVRLAEIAGRAIMANETRMLSLQAQVGSSQARIEVASTQNAAQKTALQMVRNDVVAADPYEAATELQNLQTQLETIYTITARLSGLSLTNYLRARFKSCSMS